MTTFLIMIAIWAVTYLIDQQKKNKKLEKKQDVKQKTIVSEQNNHVEENTTDRLGVEKLARDILSQRQEKAIVDRESEIYSNSITLSKEKMVDDIIFAEILSKPKSKR